jgi:hypothetical protein
MDSVKVDEWNERYVRLGLDAYNRYWDDASNPIIFDALRYALNTVANAVAEEMF